MKLDHWTQSERDALETFLSIFIEVVEKIEAKKEAEEASKSILPDPIS